jgi:sugar phosphate isomerase/epimerase
MIEKCGLSISALSNHLEGQLVLGPHDQSTDIWFKGTPEEKIKYGTDRLKKTAEAAAALDVPVVNRFIGAPNWGAWYIFPSTFELGFELFVERWGPILDFFADHCVKFAHEIHPPEQAHNIETAEKAVQVIGGKKEFGFNFDPSHFVCQGIDPVVFIKKFGNRIYHCHAKDAELVKENLALAGNMSTGDWRRPGRGFRFRVVGWSNVKWKRIITVLSEARAILGSDQILCASHDISLYSEYAEYGMSIRQRSEFVFLHHCVCYVSISYCNWWVQSCCISNRAIQHEA